MNTANTNYELHILKAAINNHLNRTLPSNANQALHLIEYRIDDLVWNIAASIYRQSGYKVDLSLIRDLTNARIESLKLLAAKEAEKAKQKVLEEQKRKLEEARLKVENKKRTPNEIQREKEARYIIWGDILNRIYEREIRTVEEAIQKAKDNYHAKYSLDKDIFDNFLESRKEIYLKTEQIVARFFSEIDLIDDEPEYNISEKDMNLITSIPDPGNGFMSYLLKELNYEFDIEIPEKNAYLVGYLTNIGRFFYLVCSMKEKRRNIR